MEGVFSFFLESTFLGLYLLGEKKLGRIAHWWSAFFVFLGSWMSGYRIVATDAWMQHPTGYRITSTGAIELASFWGLLLNPWALFQYAHNMLGAAQTGCFVMAAVGAFNLLAKRDEVYGRTFVRIGVIVGTKAREEGAEHERTVRCHPESRTVSRRNATKVYSGRGADILMKSCGYWAGFCR
jgi:cytochrome bd ubiquinol oxidase subunit I